MNVLEQLETHPEDEAVLEQLIHLNQELERLDAWSLESEAKIFCPN